MKEIVLNVEGMMCEGCENRVKNALSKIEGIKDVKASHIDKKVIIEASENIDLENVKETITDLGYDIK